MKVILYSGGLDSLCGYHVLKQADPSWKPVYFNIHSRYTEKEIQHLPYGVDVVHGSANFVDLEREDGFIPQRNVMLITLAQAMFDADEIAICSVRGEYSRDKHPRFYRQMSRLLSYTAGKPVRVFSPFEKKTKAEALKYCLDHVPSFSAWRVGETISCYDSESLACGRCMSCFRRWVALEVNGLATETMWDTPPWMSVPIAPASNLRRLPPSMWFDFALAQRDVARAYWHLWRRARNAS